MTGEELRGLMARHGQDATSVAEGLRVSFTTVWRLLREDEIPQVYRLALLQFFEHGAEECRLTGSDVIRQWKGPRNLIADALGRSRPWMYKTLNHRGLNTPLSMACRWLIGTQNKTR